MLLPLFRQLGFHRITAAGHKDKALEYGKDIWMRYTLPTQHVLYFGIQAKKGKLDASGVTKAGNANIAEIHNQALMMLAHEIFDPETNKRVLVDHAFIVAGGEITKAARNWLGNALDAPKRSQIMFMDRDDILNLYVVTNLPLPADAPPPSPADPWVTQVRRAAVLISPPQHLFEHLYCSPANGSNGRLSVHKTQLTSAVDASLSVPSADRPAPSDAESTHLAPVRPNNR